LKRNANSVFTHGTHTAISIEANIRVKHHNESLLFPVVTHTLTYWTLRHYFGTRNLTCWELLQITSC